MMKKEITVLGLVLVALIFFSVVTEAPVRPGGQFAAPNSPQQPTLGKAISPDATQRVLYAITDLGISPDWPVDGKVIPRSINENGNIVGFVDGYQEQQTFSFEWENGQIFQVGSLGLGTRVLSVNSQDQLVGEIANQAVYWDDVYSPTFILPGTLSSEARGINDNGKIVGNAWLDSHTARGFVRDGQKVFYIEPAANFDYTNAVAINNNGQVACTQRGSVGYGADRACLWKDGVSKILGTLGGYFSIAEGINSDGAVVGFSERTDSKREAFLWTNDGGMVGLGFLTPPDNPDYIPWSHAYGINDANEVVGESSWWGDPGVAPLAFLWKSGSIIDLNTVYQNDPSSRWARLVRAFDINNQGQIIGFGIKGDGRVRGFLLTPLSNI